MTVSELNDQAKTLLESHFDSIEVVGEISKFTKNASSSHWYFTLKDERASISCAMFKFQNFRVKFEPKDGQKVIIVGKVSLYLPSGSYQIIVNSMKPFGEGEMDLAFNRLKQKLEKEGLFDAKNKKPLPRFPNHVALITSVTSAAFEDMKKVASQRWRGVKFDVYGSLMQGDRASSSVIKALEIADLKGYDAIVIARGGGSLEDLWCFNDEELARAVSRAKTPIISAIGHEIDFCIIDFVSDHRSHTPTQAMIDLLPDEAVFMQLFDMHLAKLNSLINLKISNLSKSLESFSRVLILGKTTSRLSLGEHELKEKQRNLNYLSQKIIAQKSGFLTSKELILKEKEKFFAATRRLVSISFNGKFANLSELKSGDEIALCSQDTQKTAVIK